MARVRIRSYLHWCAWRVAPSRFANRFVLSAAKSVTNVRSFDFTCFPVLFPLLAPECTLLIEAPLEADA